MLLNSHFQSILYFRSDLNDRNQIK